MSFKLKSVTVENFKAITRAQIPLLSGLSVLVGQNSSGKSSVLQAVHWACRCIANPKIQRNQSRSLSVHDFDFYPTINIKSVGNNQELRQGRGGRPEVSVKVIFEHVSNNSTAPQISTVKISRGNNEAITIDLTNNSIIEEFYTHASNNERPFSSYIPGLAGVPLIEEKRSRLPIVRQAASGDANTVLRNILLLIKNDPRPDVSLDNLSILCSRVLGPISIEVDFDEARDASIRAKIRTASMTQNYWTPIEMAGTGVLQCIQIFSYIILYRPHLLLIDEPDAHLHPDRQEKLVAALSQAADEYSMSILMSTHSPNVVRAMPASAQIIWMNNGKIQQEDAATIRRKMGWGILDKKIILVTEDGEPSELMAILSQWPEIDRVTSVWPVSGHRSLPSLEACKSLLNMTGVPFMILHRDGDFMTPSERTSLKSKYNTSNIKLWITDESDIEALFLDPERISHLLDLDRATINTIYEDIKRENQTEFEDVFSRKRQEISEDRRLYEKRDECPGVATAKKEIQRISSNLGCIHGKSFSKKLKNKINSRGIDASRIFSLDASENIAQSLKTLIDDLIAVR